MEYYCKEDLMKMFKFESDKALKLLHALYAIRKAIKIGREYYVNRADLEKFLSDMNGKQIVI